MYTLWTKGLSDKEAEEFRYGVSSAKTTLKKVSEVLGKEIKRVETQRISKQQYDTPNWAMVQADLIGEHRAYQNSKNLVDNLINEEVK